MDEFEDDIDEKVDEKDKFVDKEPEELDDESIYSEDVRDQLLDDDELSPTEAAFMQGYDEASA